MLFSVRGDYGLDAICLAVNWEMIEVQAWEFVESFCIATSELQFGLCVPQIQVYMLPSSLRKNGLIRQI